MNLARPTILALIALAVLNAPGGAETIVNGVRVDSPYVAPEPNAVVPQRPALAILVNFDDVLAPCIFNDATALRNQYAGVGVTFTGPGSNDGGAILNECGNFSITGYSSPNFVAFSTSSTARLQDGGIAVGPERIQFTADVASVQVGVAGPLGGVATLTAFSATNVPLGVASHNVTTGMLTLTVNSPGIRYALLDVQGAEQGVWVFDNLSFDTSPTPVHATTWGQLKTAYR